MATADVTRDGTPQLFGHPRGLSFLFATEMWERFAYYGMRAILVLYLVNFLLLPGHAENVAGYFPIKHAFEWLGGAFSYIGMVIWHVIARGPSPIFAISPLQIQPFSSLIYGTYTAFVYLTPFFGGIIADRWLGQRYSVIVGGVLMAIAEFILMVPSLFFIGLFLLILGNGFFKPNISTQVGNLYREGDSRIDRAYSLFYVGINVGAFLSPIICGSLLGEVVGYQWGFFAAGVGMILGLLVYLNALRTLPPDRIARLKAKTAEKKRLTKSDWKAVFALVLLCIPVTFFWATYEQQGNTMNLWAQGFTDRRLIPGLLNWEIPVTLFQSFNPAMIVLFTPLVVWFWGRQSKKGTEPTTVTKMALGLFMLAVSYAIMAVAAHLTPAGHTTSWLWLFAFYAVITMGELYLSPIGLALVARVAPPQILSAMMGLWFITSFTGNLLQGVIGSFFTQMDKTQFFLLCAGIGAAAGVVTWIFNFPLKPILERKGPVHPLELAEPQADPHIEPAPAE
ncbi:MAG: peptide MFS transporter [Alphaproteobacteria bacterium]|jgi:POT family proton-dependent oligopeptide transporter